MRTEHLCAKEFQLFSHHDILWPALSSDNIRAKQIERRETWTMRKPTTIQRESKRFHFLVKMEVKSAKEVFV